MYKRRRDPCNFDKLQDAIKKFINISQNMPEKKTHNFNEQSEKLKASDSKSWKLVNKLLDSNVSAPVQPLIRTDKNYERISSLDSLI